MKFSRSLLLVLFAASLVFSSLACGFSFDTQTLQNQVFPTPMPEVDLITRQVEPAQVIVQPTVISQPLLVTNEEAILVDLYQKINPSVVNIITYISQANLVRASGQGSGFLYDTQGHIVTNSHVIHGSDQIEVIFSNGQAESARIIGEDLHSDLAVIKVERFPDGTFPLTLGKMEEVAVGQTAVALGNPFGLGGTLTRGIISALGRTIPALTPFSIPQAIQTDAPINPGNSGGPLLNLAGQVIGVNAQIETSGTSRSNSGVGFAIPVSIVSRVVPELIANGKFEWSWLGVVGGNLSAAAKDAMKISIDKGAYISEVVTGGPADRAGLRGSTRQITVDNRLIEIGGDIIIAIDGVPVNTFEDILIYIALNTRPGQIVQLTIVRNGEQQTLPLTLQPRPSDTREFLQP